MSVSWPEIADIFRSAGPAYRAAHDGHLSLHQLKVMAAIVNCRTAALGGHVEDCDDCGHRRIAYNSCRNRTPSAGHPTKLCLAWPLASSAPSARPE